MFKGTILVVGFLALPGGALIDSVQDKTSSPERNRVQHPVKFEAEADLPKDKAGEQRRNNAVLEAALNDLASPENPENKNQIENTGPGREIVINDETCTGDQSLINLG